MCQRQGLCQRYQTFLDCPMTTASPSQELSACLLGDNPSVFCDQLSSKLEQHSGIRDDKKRDIFQHFTLHL